MFSEDLVKPGVRVATVDSGDTRAKVKILSALVVEKVLLVAFGEQYGLFVVVELEGRHMLLASGQDVLKAFTFVGLWFEGAGRHLAFVVAG